MKQYFGPVIIAKTHPNAKTPDQVPNANGMLWVNRVPAFVREVILLEQHDTFVSSLSIDSHNLVICDMPMYNAEVRTGKPPVFPIAANKTFVASFDANGMVSRFLHEHYEYLASFAKCVGEYDIVVAYVSYER